MKNALTEYILAWFELNMIPKVGFYKMLSLNTSIKSLDRSLIGICGVHFVAAELACRGMIPAITMRNTKGIDILVSNQDGNKSIEIQVKTTFKRKEGWVLSKNAETQMSDSLFYIFVDLSDDTGFPKFHIVPSKKVAEYVARTHHEWLKTPSKKGEPHRDNTMRIFMDSDNQYFGKWEELGL